MADGTIIIDTKIDNSGVEEGIDELKKTVESSAKEAADEMEDAAKQAEKNIKESAKRTSKEVERSTKQSGEKSSQSTKKSQEEQREEYKKTEEQSRKSAENTQKYWTGAADKIKSIIGTAAKAAGAAAVTGLAAATKTGMDFEAQMSRVRAISGANNEEFARLNDQAKQLGADTAFSALEAAEGMENLASAGFDVEETIAAMPGMLNLAASSGEDLASSADIAASTLRGFKMDASEAGHVADVLAKNAADTNAAVADTGEAMKYVAPVASAMGIEFEETAASIGIMADAGIKGSQAGTTLRGALSRIAKPTKVMRETMDELGISFYDADGKMKSLTDMTAMLEEKTAGLSEEQKNQALITLFGQESLSGMLALISRGSGELQRLTEEYKNCDGSAEEMAKTMQDNLKGAVEQLGGSAESLGIELYENIEEPLKDVTEAATEQINDFTDALKDNGIEGIIPEETVTTVKNLGSAASAAAKGGVKALGAGMEFLGENLSTVLPVAAGLLTVVKGYAALKTVAPVLATVKTEINGIRTGMTPLGTAVKFLTGQTMTATTATGLLSTAVTALGGPVGIVVLAVGALTAGIAAYALTQEHAKAESLEYADACEELSKKQDEAAKSIENLKEKTSENVSETRAQGVQADNLFKKLKDLIKVEDKSAGTKAQIKSVVEELNGILPDLGLIYDEETDKLNKSTKAIRNNIDALKEQAMAKAYQSGMEEWAEKVADATVEYENASETYAKAEEKLDQAKDKEAALIEEHGLGSGNKELGEAAQDVLNYQAALDSAGEALTKTQDNLSQAEAGLAEYSDKFTNQTNYVDYLNNLDNLAKEAGIKAKKIPESVSLGIQQGLYSVPTTGDELKNLIKLDSLVQEAKTAGVQVPASVAQGIQSGKYALPASVAQMKALIRLDDLQSQTFVSGVKVPENMAKGIASGKTKPAAAVRQMNNLVKFDDLVKNSGISGTSAVQSLVASVNAGKTKPKKAIEQMLNLMGDATDKSAKKSGEKSGKQVAESTSEGIDKNKGKVKESSQEAVKDAQDVDYSGFRTLGGNMMLGLAAGIDENSSIVSSAAQRAVRNAKNAANAEADSHSPSRIFEKEVGKFLPLGLAKGIIDNTDAVEDASRDMAKASVKTTADELEINSPSKVYKKAIGKFIPSGVAKGVREAQGILNTEMKSMVSEALDAARTASAEGNYSEIGNNLISRLSTALSTAQQDSSETIQDIISRQQEKVSNKNSKREEKLQKKIDDTKKKKKKKQLKKELKELQKQNKKEEKRMQEAGEAMANAYNTAFQKESERLTAIAQEQIQKLSEEYQEQYNEIKTQMDSLISKQQSWGNIYDLDQNIYDLKRYQENIKALEKNIPESMMERILGMNVDEASAYMDWFRAMSAEEQKAYIEKWNTQQDMAKSFSESFFADDFAKIEAEYNAKLKAATDNLRVQMEQAGQNIAAGLTVGMEKETRNMTKAMKKICNQLVKTVKKTLKINSPSKRFEQIGRYNLQGAERGHEKEAPKLYRQVEAVSETMAQKFAKAKLNIPELQSRMQSAVSRQTERISGAQVRVAFAGTGNGTVKEQTIYTGPEKIEVPVVLEGREIARVTAPYMDKKLDDITNRKTRGGV